MRRLLPCCAALLLFIPFSISHAAQPSPAVAGTTVEKPLLAQRPLQSEGAHQPETMHTSSFGQKKLEPTTRAVPVGQLLVRNQPSFFDPSFYRRAGARRLPAWSERSPLDLFSSRFWQDQGILVVLHLLLASFLIGLMRSHRRRSTAAAERSFVLRHPFAAGLFVSTAVLAPCYRNPPSGWLLMLTIIAVLSAVPLINGLFAEALQRQTVRLLAFFFILIKAVQSLSLTPSLYSLCLAGLSLGGILVLRNLAGRSTGPDPDHLRHFRSGLILGMTLLVLVFLALAGGYGNLAEYLLNAGFKTLFACLLTVLILHILQFGIEALAGLRLFARQGFLHRHGAELLKRIRHLAALAVITGAGLYLTVAWRLFDTLGEAWHGIFSAGIGLNGKTISAKMVLVGLATLYFTVLFSWLLRSLLEEEVFPRRQLDRGIRDSINKLLHYALLALGVLMALSLAGIELKNFAVLAGALGIGIGFGLQNIVNNFVSGLILLFERPIKNGDMIVLDDEWGEVRKIGLRSTTVETFDQSEVIVPNSILVSEKVTNWTLSNEQCRVVVPVGVAYGSDIEKVLQVLYEAAGQHPAVLDAPPASAIFTSFGSSSLDFELRVWARSVSQRLVIKSDLLLYIDRRFREEGIEIPFPQRDLHLRSVDDEVFKGWGASVEHLEPPEGM